MVRFYKVYPTKIMNDFSVYRHIDSDGNLVLRSRYRDLACTLCGKIDEMEALKRGLEIDAQIKTSLDTICRVV